MALLVDRTESAGTSRPRFAVLREAGGTLAARARTAGARSRRNFLSYFALLRHRHANRPANYPALPWQTPAILALAAILYTMIFIDVPVAAYRGQWPAWLLHLAGKVTDIGLGAWYLVPAALILLAVNLGEWRGRTRRGLLLLYNWTSLASLVLVSTGLSGLVSTIVKRIVGRARPGLFDQYGAFEFQSFATRAEFASFPSGHATILGSVAGLLWVFFPRWRVVTAPVAIFCAHTRVLTGSHYPSDVIAGFAFGFACAMVACMIFSRLGYLFRAVDGRLPVLKRSARLRFWLPTPVSEVVWGEDRRVRR